MDARMGNSFFCPLPHGAGAAVNNFAEPPRTHFIDPIQRTGKIPRNPYSSHPQEHLVLSQGKTNLPVVAAL
jgi:hypothetical protein